MNPLERLKEAQKELDLNNRQMAAELRISEYWISKVLNGHRPPSDDLMLRLEDLLRRKNVVMRTTPPMSGQSESRPASPNLHTPKSRLKPGRLLNSGSSSGPPPMVASRIIPAPGTPSSRADCEAYVAELFDEAERSGKPNAFPVIYDRLERQFPRAEWETPKTKEP